MKIYSNLPGWLQKGIMHLITKLIRP